MKLSQLAFLADENIHPDVVEYLRKSGLDVATAQDEGLSGLNDIELMRCAFRANRVVLTHDADCGTLAVAANEPVKGIVYLRPGHIQAQFTTTTLRTILDLDLDVTPPFILVAARQRDRVRIRLRAI